MIQLTKTQRLLCAYYRLAEFYRECVRNNARFDVISMVGDKERDLETRWLGQPHAFIMKDILYGEQQYIQKYAYPHRNI